MFVLSDFYSQKGNPMSDATHSSMSPIELLSILGYGLANAWMVISFYWLFCDFPPEASLQTRDFAQLWIFLGIPIGYLVLHILGRRPSYSLFYRPFIAACLVAGSLLPIVCFIAYQSHAVPYPTFCVVGFLAGFAFAVSNVSWLDIASRLRIEYFGRYTGSAFVIAGILFVLTTFLPVGIQPIFCLAFLLGSVGLLLFASRNAEGNAESAPIEATSDSWHFAKEIEPSLFMFGVVFSLSFVFVFNFGQEYVFAGLSSIIAGALIAVILSAFHKEIGITYIQRFLVVLMVLTCVITPFADQTTQLACACAMIASWAFFTSVNYGFILKKVVKEKAAPLFREAPIRLVFNASGFFLGWLITAIITIVSGAHSNEFTTVRLTCVVVLVVIMMVFIPRDEHHHVSGEVFVEPQANDANSIAVEAQISAQEIYEAKCEKLAEEFGLSPREKDVLLYLGKGRNVAYIQEKLVISPHTVKSHVYNIYRKTDIHSQQKLMDHIEEIELN